MRAISVQTVLSFALVALLAEPLAAQDWVGRGRAHGRVVSEQGAPVGGAKVTLHLPGRPEAGPEPEVTGGNGRWAFGGLTGGNWVVVIEAEGYMTSEGSFRVNEFAPSPAMEVTMQRNLFSGIQEGQALIDQGRYAEARRRFEEVLPDMEVHQQAQLRALIGTTYYEEKDFPAAAEEYEKALPDLSPSEQLSIRLRLGDSYAQLRHYDRARATYEQALAGLEGEGRNAVLLAIARSYDLEDDREGAIETVERLLAADPQNLQALQLIADLLSREGREAEAQEYLDRIPETETLPADMLLNQGIRFYNDNDYDEAVSIFDRVIRQDPGIADAYYYRGLSYLAQTRNDEAAADLEKYLELEPAGTYADQVGEFLEYLRPR